MNKSGILRKENKICVFINTFATLLIYFRVYLFTKKKKIFVFTKWREKFKEILPFEKNKFISW